MINIYLLGPRSQLREDIDIRPQKMLWILVLFFIFVLTTHILKMKIVSSLFFIDKRVCFFKKRILSLPNNFVGSCPISFGLHSSRIRGAEVARVDTICLYLRSFK